MNFEWKNGLIWVSFDLTYEGITTPIHNCIFDTGSAGSAIDIDLVNFNFQKPGIIRQLQGIGGGEEEVVSQVVDKIFIDQQELSSINLEFGDLSEDLGVQGFIGNDILSHFSVYIDYNTRNIHLKPSS